MTFSEADQFFSITKSLSFQNLLNICKIIYFGQLSDAEKNMKKHFNRTNCLNFFLVGKSLGQIKRDCKFNSSKSEK